MPRKVHDPKPRNPYVAAAKFRRAGAHGKTEKARRRQDAVALIHKLRGSRRNGGGEVFQLVVLPLDGPTESLPVAFARPAPHHALPSHTTPNRMVSTVSGAPTLK